MYGRCEVFPTKECLVFGFVMLLMATRNLARKPVDVENITIFSIGFPIDTRWFVGCAMSASKEPFKNGLIYPRKAHYI